jgi:hypothetical protein
MMVRQKDIRLSVLLISLDSKNPPLLREFEELIHYCEEENLYCYCEEENLYLVIGCDSNTHHMVWGSITCSDGG